MTLSDKIVLAKHLLAIAEEVINGGTSDYPIDIVEALIPKIPPNTFPFEPSKISVITPEQEEHEKIYFSDLDLIDNTIKQDVGAGTHNILQVYDYATEAEHEFWGKFYIHAHQDVSAIAKKYNMPFDLTAAVVAILSPNTRWRDNLRMAESVIRLASSYIEDVRRARYENKLRKFVSELEHLVDVERRLAIKYHKTPMGMKGEIYEEVKKAREEIKAKREEVRIFKNKYMGLIRKHVESPKTKKPEDIGKFMVSYPKNIRKAINLIDSEDIDYWLVGPKVTAFYRSIIDPEKTLKQAREMVIDGHAVFVWLGAKKTVKSGPKPTGSRRIKIIKSYAKASIKRNVTISQVQSVVWFLWQSVIDRPKQDPEKELEEAPF